MSEYDSLMLKKWKKLPESKKQEILARIPPSAAVKVLERLDLDELVKELEEAYLHIDT